MVMNANILQELSRIIERDRADTTYKYALLRATADICENYSQHEEHDGGRTYFPLGLLVDRWLYYYYPLIASPEFIPQKGSERPLNEKGKKVSFRKYFKKIIYHYKGIGDISQFQNEYEMGTFSEPMNNDLLVLLRDLKRTIIEYPMKHLGSKKDDYYRIFRVEDKPPIRKQKVSRKMVIKEFGTFSIPTEYYETLKILGSYVSGDASILNKWARFTVNADPEGHVTYEKIMRVLTTQHVTDRNVKDAEKLYKKLQNEEVLTCTWSDKRISKRSKMNVDHLIPFSLTRNNDLWNLLPTTMTANQRKKAKVPTPKVLQEKKKHIMYYWSLMREEYANRFGIEIQISLTGFRKDKVTLEDAFKAVTNWCDRLISKGYEEWSG